MKIDHLSVLFISNLSFGKHGTSETRKHMVPEKKKKRKALAASLLSFCKIMLNSGICKLR